jgi:hypothetical protein
MTVLSLISSWILHCTHLTLLELFATPNSLTSKSKPKLYYDRRSVGQSVLVSGTRLGSTTNFPPSPLIIFRQLRIWFSYGFVDLRRPLWREVGSIIFSFFCWTSPEQPSPGLSPLRLMSIFHCLYFLGSLELEGQIVIYWLSSSCYIATNGQSARLPWYRSPIQCLRPDFYYCRTFRF